MNHDTFQNRSHDRVERTALRVGAAANLVMAVAAWLTYYRSN